jgi:uncharacterized membrane protein (UPF0127 family)
MQPRALLLLAAALVACSAAPAVTIETKGGPRRVTVEVANTDATRTRGLMYRDRLPDGRGMLFAFDVERDHSFWMKNTLIPLDMIFIGSDGRVVGVHANATPYSLTPIAVGRPSRWVLEVAGGWAERAGVAAGDRVDLSAIP